MWTDLGFIEDQQKSGNHRFATYVVSKDDQKFFAKKVIDPKLTRDLENEIWWHLSLKRLSEASPKLLAVAPELIDYGKNWYVAEFFDAPLLLNKEDTDLSKLDQVIDRLVNLLVNFDQQLLTRNTGQPLYEETNSAPYTNLWKKVDGWMEKPLEAKIISPSQIEKSRSLIDSHRQYVLPSIQHGDFVPWHMFDLGEKTGIVDGEHSSLVKPRYYDLCYLYSRLYTWSGAKEQARQILKGFVDKSVNDTDKFFQAMLPVMTLRALGMHNDSIADLEERDYRKDAKELLEMCLSGKLDNFV